MWICVSYDRLSFYTTGNLGTVQNPACLPQWMDFTWGRGRQLESATKTGISAAYEYNDRGIRTKKTVGSVVTEYHLVGSRVTWESDGTNTLYYYYNGAGDLFGLSHNGVKHYYVKNAQGDIIRILDETGAVVVEYTYDTWGKMVGTPVDNSQVNLAELNPYRYRSYRYDAETGFYYLNSRYYDPEVGRFINADHAAVSCFAPMGLTDKNLFAYCDNNPVVRKDADGDAWFIAPIAAGAVLGGFGGAIGRVISNSIDGREWYDGILSAAVGQHYMAGWLLLALQ